MYAHHEIYDEVLKYFNGNELAADVWLSKYALKKDGLYLERTPSDMHRRLAKEFSRIEDSYLTGKPHEDLSDYGKSRSALSEDEIFELFADFKNIIPQGSVMAVAGDKNYVGSLSNCVVLENPHDSYGGIMYSDQQLVQLMKRRSGVGVNISTLRPEGAAVKNAAKSSTGVVSFMERFSATTREVAQAGRRGALMITIDCRHPDVEKFITVKQDKTKVTGANVSVMWTDDFMSAVENDDDYTLRWPVDSSPEEAKVTKVVRAVDVWNLAVECATASAEPGMIFLDRMRNYSTCHPYQELISTNPCVLEGTLVDTPNGQIPVENLKVGDLIHTLDGTQPIKIIKTFNDQQTFRVEFSDGGIQNVTEDHRYLISRAGNIDFTPVYLLNVGDEVITYNPYKKDENGLWGDDGYAAVVSITTGKIGKVYDLETEDDTWITSGYVQQGCSEIGMGHDSCRLIALNMMGSVVNPYTPNAYFDHDHWYRICYEGMVLSDDLVDLELEYVERIIKKIHDDPEPAYIKDVELRTWTGLLEAGKRGRRTGLGFTALGDALAALNLKYDEAFDQIEEIMLTKFRAEWDATTDLAIIRGKMPYMIESGFIETEFTEFLHKTHPSAYERMLEHGRRNLSISTVAPTGSLSLLAKIGHTHGTTSGIEPVFSPWYTRRKKINPNDTDVRVDFVDSVGDSWQEFKVFHNGIVDYAIQNDLTGDLSDHYLSSAYVGSAANEIDWVKRVKIQALIQKYVTHSISSTINLPRGTLPDTVGTIYREAYQNGLKGITVYVDGSRDGVLVTDNNTFIIKNDSPKRPQKLPCKVVNTSIKGEYWLVLIGILGEDPYEVFAFPNGRVSYNDGVIIKEGKGSYRLEVDGKIVIPNIPMQYQNDTQEALTRMISASLRHGVDPKFIIEQLSKSSGTVVDFSKAISRALKSFLKSGETLLLRCSDCGSKSLKLEEGCYTCLECGYSGCG